MKALTLHQPWASLVAVGAKKIETRSWSTEYRGRVAIHAARREPPTLLRALRWTGDSWSMEYGGRGDHHWYLASEVPEQMPVADAEDVFRLPFGAVVASATLVDVVPIVVQHEDAADLGTHYITATSRSAFLWHPYDQEPHDETMRDYPGEAPFGDFSLGRFAWLLDDVARVEDRCPWCRGRGVLTEPERDPLHTGRKVKVDCPVCSGAGKCDPVPARGRQGLWEWSAPDEEKRKG